MLDVIDHGPVDIKPIFTHSHCILLCFSGGKISFVVYWGRTWLKLPAVINYGWAHETGCCWRENQLFYLVLRGLWQLLCFYARFLMWTLRVGALLRLQPLLARTVSWAIPWQGVSSAFFPSGWPNETRNWLESIDLAWVFSLCLLDFVKYFLISDRQLSLGRVVA